MLWQIALCLVSPSFQFYKIMHSDGSEQSIKYPGNLRAVLSHSTQEFRPLHNHLPGGIKHLSWTWHRLTLWLSPYSKNTPIINITLQAKIKCGNWLACWNMMNGAAQCLMGHILFQTARWILNKYAKWCWKAYDFLLLFVLQCGTNSATRLKSLFYWWGGSRAKIPMQHVCSELLVSPSELIRITLKGTGMKFFVGLLRSKFPVELHHNKYVWDCSLYFPT